jgi:hypothetical protein
MGTQGQVMAAALHSEAQQQDLHRLLQKLPRRALTSVLLLRVLVTAHRDYAVDEQLRPPHAIWYLRVLPIYRELLQLLKVVQPLQPAAARHD